MYHGTLGHSFCGPQEEDVENPLFIALQAKVNEELRPEMRSLDQMMVGLHRLSKYLAKYIPLSKHLGMLQDYLVTKDYSRKFRCINSVN